MCALLQHEKRGRVAWLEPSVCAVLWSSVDRSKSGERGTGKVVLAAGQGGLVARKSEGPVR